MYNLGYPEEEYPYWIREDGVKMFGDYIIVAANLELRPRGTIIECSLGTAIVCDTGGFAKKNKTQLDIAVNWE
jgi:3D (Asp-Asp-Asp) domain-containing protein